MWENQSPQMVLDSIAEMQKGIRAATERGYQTFTDYYVGGDELASTLIAHSTEKPEEFTRRKQRFTSINYVTPLADSIINSLYGPRVTRSIEGAEEGDRTQEEWEWIWQINNWQRKMLDSATLFVPLGDAFARLYWRENAVDPTLSTLALAVLRPENILPIPDPTDVDKLQALVECRPESVFKNGKFEQRLRYFCWTAEEFGELEASKDGSYATFKENSQGQRAMEPNKYGCIPYAHFKGRNLPGQYLGLSLIRDAVTIQREVNNRSSVLTVVIQMQGFSPLVIAGEAPDKLSISEKGFIKTAADGKVYYIQPNAPIAETQASIEWLIEKLFETGGVPISVVRSGDANSGVQLAIEYKPLADIVQRLKNQCTESERELFEIGLKIQLAHGVPVDPNAQVTIDFPESFLPTDKNQEMMTDLMLVNNTPPLMSREEFWRKWNPDLTAEAVEEKAQEIDQSFATGRQTRANLIPPVGRPIPGTEEEAE